VIKGPSEPYQPQHCSPIMHPCAEPLEPEVIKGPSEPYDGTKEYAKDKRRQVAIAERFAELWHKSGACVSLCPGFCSR